MSLIIPYQLHYDNMCNIKQLRLEPSLTNSFPILSETKGRYREIEVASYPRSHMSIVYNVAIPYEIYKYV